jgi:hypothetical protein
MDVRWREPGIVLLLGLAGPGLRRARKWRVFNSAEKYQKYFQKSAKSSGQEDLKLLILNQHRQHPWR